MWADQPILYFALHVLQSCSTAHMFNVFSGLRRRLGGEWRKDREHRLCGLAHRLRSTGILIGDKVDPAPVDVAIVGDRTTGAHRLADDAVGRRRL